MMFLMKLAMKQELNGQVQEVKQKNFNNILKVKKTEFPFPQLTI
jgi:hypothetical protein